MNRFLFMAKPLSVFMALMFFYLGVIRPSSAQATMISTDQSMKINEYQLNREKLKNMLERKEVQKQLKAWGVKPDDAQAMVDSLKDDEIAVIAQEMDKLPAGRNALGVIVGAALVVFLVLLITDLLGYTDVFPFTKKTK